MAAFSFYIFLKRYHSASMNLLETIFITQTFQPGLPCSWFPMILLVIILFKHLSTPIYKNGIMANTHCKWVLVSAIRYLNPEAEKWEMHGLIIVYIYTEMCRNCEVTLKVKSHKEISIPFRILQFKTWSLLVMILAFSSKPRRAKIWKVAARHNKVT